VGLISSNDSIGELPEGETLKKDNWVMFTCKYVVSLKVERIREYDSSPVLKNRLMLHFRKLPITLHVISSLSPMQTGAVSAGLMIDVAVIVNRP
jgi:hypothetical protein